MSSRRSAPSPRTSVALALIFVATAAVRPGALQTELLRSVGSLPPHIVGLFEEPASFQQAATGVYYVFDRRGHSVYTIDPARTAARKAVDIGQEAGRIIEPFGFDVAADGSFVVGDAPRGRQRIQTFAATGDRLNGFFIPGQPAARITVGNQILNGVSSIQHTGSTLLLSHPESGWPATRCAASASSVRPATSRIPICTSR